MNVQRTISEDVFILDECYGENRDVDADMGGFVVVCEKNEALSIEGFDKNFDTPESVQAVCPYVRMHYISGTERNIVIYERR